MRHLAITGIVTASWMPLIMSGSDMRATPPSRRMSAGTRSSAMTAHAPASSAILACSASTTSMITPPLSISARPPLTRIVPTSCIDGILPGEESLDGFPEHIRLLEEREVTCIVDQDELGARDALHERRGGCRAADEVVAAGDHERLRVDPLETRAEVERARVERAQRLRREALDRDERAVALVPGREVDGRHLVPHPRVVLGRLVLARRFALQRGDGFRVPRLAGRGFDRPLRLLVHLRREGGKPAREHELAHVLRERDRVRSGDKASVREAQ